MSNKQTAVEWLVEQYANENYSVEVYEQAKAMEKEQIEKAFQYSMVAMVLGKILSPKEYYEKTYGK